MAEKKTKRTARGKKEQDTKARGDERDDLGLRDALGEAMEVLAPAVKHLLMAEKELLLAVRAVLDKAIEKTDECAARQEKRGQRARKVKIKVD